MGSKYIVRQPIKNAEGAIIGHEIMYYGENEAFSEDEGNAVDYAAADTIYSFLTENSNKVAVGGGE